MEVYILDDLLRRTAVIDQFNSMIWTERWRDKGDFELVVNSSPAMRRRMHMTMRVRRSSKQRVLHSNESLRTE